SAVDTEVEVLKSRSLAERVTTALKLDNDSEFNSRLRPGNPISSIINAIGLGEAPSPGAGKLDDVQQQKVHEAVVDHVLARLSVTRQGLTYVIDVSFASQDPTKATTIANTFAEKYLSEQLEAKYEA